MSLERNHDSGLIENGIAGKYLNALSVASKNGFAVVGSSSGG
jgi:hypothetical protein